MKDTIYIVREEDLWSIRIPGDLDLARRWAVHYARYYGGVWFIDGR